MHNPFYEMVIGRARRKATGAEVPFVDRKNGELRTVELFTTWWRGRYVQLPYYLWQREDRFDVFPYARKDTL